MWGLAPLFFRALKPATPIEILSHRVVWSLLLMIVLVAVLRDLRDVPRALSSLRKVGLYVGDDGPGDDQLGAVHLGRQQRPYRADKPGLLHQPAGQCPARHAVPGRAAEPQTSALRGTGDARRHQPAHQSGGVAVDIAHAGDVVRLLRPDPQEGRHRSAGRAAGRNGDADALGAGLSALAVGQMVRRHSRFRPPAWRRC